MPWLGYEPEDDTMLDCSAVKDLAALEEYSKQKFGMFLILIWDVLGMKSGREEYRFLGYNVFLSFILRIVVL